MILSGRIWKDGKFWLIECKELDALTQGSTKAHALDMMVDWVRTALDNDKFPIEIRAYKDARFSMSFQDPKPVLGLMIERMRLAENLTYQAVADKLKIASRSAIKSYVDGKHDPQFSKIQSLMNVMGYDIELRIRKRTA